MDPFLQEKLWDLGINILSVLIGGGLIVGFVEWQRHRREQQQWQREDAKLEIDVPRAVIRFNIWSVEKDASDKQKLLIYENGLLGKVRKYQILTDLVIRNTTSGELVITTYGVEEIPAPSYRTYRCYDLENVRIVDTTNLPPTTLRPLGTILRTFLIICDLSSSEAMDTPPNRVRIYAEASDGSRVQKEIELKTSKPFPVHRSPSGIDHPITFIEKVPSEQLAAIDMEIEIPF